MPAHHAKRRVNQLVILSKLEQEYLLGIIESSIYLREPRQFFLWTPGP